MILVNVALIGVFVVYYLSNITAGVLDSAQFFFDTESITKMFGTITGFILAIAYEKKYVKFTNNKSIIKNIIRFVIGLAIIMATRFLLSYLFGLIIDTESLAEGQGFKAIIGLLLDYVRYLVMLFIGIGLYPKLFKKFNF